MIKTFFVCFYFNLKIPSFMSLAAHPFGHVEFRITNIRCCFLQAGRVEKNETNIKLQNSPRPNQWAAEDGSQRKKNSRFVNSKFVKTCDELVPRSGSWASISGSIWISTVGSTNVHNLILQLADYSAVCCAQHSGVSGYVRHWHGLYLAVEGISGKKTNRIELDV